MNSNQVVKVILTLALQDVGILHKFVLPLHRTDTLVALVFSLNNLYSPHLHRIFVADFCCLAFASNGIYLQFVHPRCDFCLYVRCLGTFPSIAFDILKPVLCIHKHCDSLAICPSSDYGVPRDQVVQRLINDPQPLVHQETKYPYPWDLCIGIWV